MSHRPLLNSQEQTLKDISSQDFNKESVCATVRPKTFTRTISILDLTNAKDVETIDSKVLKPKHPNKKDQNTDQNQEEKNYSNDPNNVTTTLFSSSPNTACSSISSQSSNRLSTTYDISTVKLNAGDSQRLHDIEMLRSVTMFPNVTFENLLKNPEEKYMTSNRISEVLRTEPCDFSTGDYYDLILRKGVKDPSVNRKRSEFLRKSLYNIGVAKQTPLLTSEVTALKFHDSENPTIFAGDSIGNLGILSVCLSTGEQTTASLGPEKTLSLDQDKEGSLLISRIETTPLETEKIYTSSVNGHYISHIDLRQLKPIFTYSFPENYGITDTHASSNMLLFSSTRGDIGRIDLRQPITERNIMISNLQNSPLSGFDISPLNENLMAIISPEHRLKIWDLRFDSNTPIDTNPHSILDMGVQTLGNCESISWNTNNQILTTCKDFNAISIINIDPQKSPQSQISTPIINIRHNLHVDKYSFLPLTTQWQKTPNDNIQKFVISNLSQYTKRSKLKDQYFFDVYDSLGNPLVHLSDWRFCGPVKTTSIHDSLNFIAAGTSSGRVYLFI